MKISELSRLSGRSRRAILDMIDRGELPGYRDALGNRVVSDEALNILLRPHMRTSLLLCSPDLKLDDLPPSISACTTGRLLKITDEFPGFDVKRCSKFLPLLASYPGLVSVVLMTDKPAALTFLSDFAETLLENGVSFHIFTGLCALRDSTDE